MSEARPYIELDFLEYETREFGRIIIEPRLQDVMKIFENIKAKTRERLSSTTMPSLVAAVTTPAGGVPIPPDGIRKALAQGKVTAGIQPYRALEDPNLESTNPLLKDLEGCEALMKIIKDAETLERAGETIKTSDEIPGLTGQIDLAVLENASLLILIINELRRGIGLEPFPIAFNCSLDLVTKEDFANDILAVLDGANTPTNFCTVEILEKIHDLDKNQVAQFKMLAEAGVHIAIDDFDQRVNGGGTDDLVLQKLQAAEVPIFRLKVDGKTTSTITTEEGKNKAKKIIEIAISHKIESIVFEGGYNNLTTAIIEQLKIFENEYRGRIKFLVEGTVVDEPSKSA